MTYGREPERVGNIAADLREVMYYLYLPVKMAYGVEVKLPPNLEPCRRHLINAWAWAEHRGLVGEQHYMYLSARKGWATPDNPLNRPGWHCDGFGTNDLNFVWWKGPGTRFLTGDVGKVPDDHKASLEHFEAEAEEYKKNLRPNTRIVDDLPEQWLYAIDPQIVHATPEIKAPCWRQYVKVSISLHKYNLENNSHNFLFDYDWPMFGREEVRNDTHRGQRDYA